MSSNKFSLSVCKDLLENGPLKDSLDAKNYITKYFFPISHGMILFKNGDQKAMLTNDAFKQTYGRIGKPLMKWFNNDTLHIYDIIVDTKKGFLNGSDLNIFGGFKYDSKASELKEDMKEGVDMMLQFIKTVWCSGNEDSYTYIINWFANLCQGNKNNTILYLKSFTEGIGKSSVTSFLMKHVLGNKICIESNSDPLKTAYNEILSGKLLVVFEELECASTGEWNVMSTKLKRWTTSDEIVYTDKYIKGYTSNNINNYIICTNSDAIKTSEGRRYYICDLDTKYKGNHTFFNKLYETCFNDNVGESFFNYMKNLDVSKFNAQSFSETKAKQISQADRLHTLFKFIKFNYILNDLDMNINTKDLFDEYSKYLTLTGSNVSMTKNKMISLLREHEIEYKTSNSKMTWFFVDDNEEHEENKIISEPVSDKIKIMKSEYDAMKLEIEQLESKQESKQETKTQPKTKSKSKPKTKAKHEDRFDELCKTSVFDEPTKTAPKVETKRSEPIALTVEHRRNTFNSILEKVRG